MNIRFKVALAALVLTTAASAGAGGDKSRNYVAYLQGSWTSGISIRNCVTGDVLAGPFQGLSTFHQGGTLSETRVSAPTNPRGPGHGLWYRTGAHQFQLKIVFQRFDMNGFLLGTQEILATNDVSKDGFGPALFSAGDLRIPSATHRQNTARCGARRELDRAA